MSPGHPSELARPASEPRAGGFPSFLQDVREAVDGALKDWLRARVALAAEVSEDAQAAAVAVAGLSLRGGKRVRAALVAAAYVAFAGDAPDVTQGASAWRPALPAMLAIELLQTYLLIHDDWMDDDPVRRGGPSVHVALRERFHDDALGDATAILAGDLACGYAQAALLESEVAPSYVLEAARALARIQRDVVTGQVAEMCAGTARSARAPSVEAVYALKTASYTVTGPLALGAALSGAAASRIAGLERFGTPLGVAFQLRDDVLGTFGDPTATGKPVGNDIRRGKRTALVEELARDGSSSALLSRVLGNAEAPNEAVDEVLGAMESSGARAQVERRIRALLDEANDALRAIEGLSTQGRALLEGAVLALGDRTA